MRKTGASRGIASAHDMTEPRPRRPVAHRSLRGSKSTRTTATSSSTWVPWTRSRPSAKECSRRSCRARVPWIWSRTRARSIPWAPTSRWHPATSRRRCGSRSWVPPPTRGRLPAEHVGQVVAVTRMHRAFSGAGLRPGPPTASKEGRARDAGALPGRRRGGYGAHIGVRCAITPGRPASSTRGCTTDHSSRPSASRRSSASRPWRGSRSSPPPRWWDARSWTSSRRCPRASPSAASRAEHAGPRRSCPATRPHCSPRRDAPSSGASGARSRSHTPGQSLRPRDGGRAPRARGRAAGAPRAR